MKILFCFSQVILMNKKCTENQITETIIQKNLSAEEQQKLITEIVLIHF